MMEALAYLCEQGGDPTILCKKGRTPKTIAEEDDCRMAAALLGINNFHLAMYSREYLYVYLK